MKLLTIAIPCYNSEQHMLKCIYSVLEGGERVEIIVINDGSTDQTGKIADELSKKFPSIIKVVNQSNSGHGEGINQGIRLASGRYFKVVDSDDWIGEQELKMVLDRLEEAEQEDSIDMLITNYVYEHSKKSKQRKIRYHNVFPKNRVVGWKDTRPFLEYQYLTIHSVIYNTAILRTSRIKLPKHVFYEDNLFVYKPLPLVKKVVYLDLDFYHYQIGHSGQSVAEQELKKNYIDQVRIAKEIFFSHNLTAVKKDSPKLGRYMYHEAKMMLIMATAFARLNKTDEAEEQVRQLWNEVVLYDSVIGKKIRYRSEAALVNRQSHIGRAVCIFLYRLAHKIILFN